MDRFNSFSLILFAVSILIYINSLDCGFVFDDVSAIRDNQDLRPKTPLKDLFWNDFWGTPMHADRSHKSYRPLTVLTFRWNYMLNELNPVGYHLVNVLLHAAVVLIFFRFCLDYLEEGFAFIAAMIFAVHPIHTEAVTGVVGRAELLSSIFFLLSLLCYRSFVKVENMSFHDWLKIGGVVLLATLGTLCKEQSITVIGVCCAFEVIVIQKITLPKLRDLLVVMVSPEKSSSKTQVNMSKTRIKLKQSILRILVLLGSTAALLYARIKVMGAQLPVFTNFDNPAAHSPAPTRQLTYNYLLPVNIWLLLCPSMLTCDWTMGTIQPITLLGDPRNLATLIFYVCMAGLCWQAFVMKGSSNRTLAMGLCMLILPFLPASNLFFPVGFVVAERVLYTPSMGICIMEALGLQLLWQNFPQLKKPLSGILVLILTVFCVKTFMRNYDWRSEYTLFSSAIKVNTRNAKLWNNVGHSLEHDGRFLEALPYFKKAVSVQPDDIGAHINVGRTLMSLNMTDEAEEAYKEALALFPQPKKGVKYTTRLAPNHLKVFINLSNLLIRNQSRLEEADNYLKRAISMRADFVDAYQNRGDILIRMGRIEEAKQQYIIGLQYQPNNADLHFNLGVVNLETKRKQEALHCFQQALRYNPEHKQARYNVAALLSEVKDNTSREAAKLEFIKMIHLNNEPAQAYFSLAMMETDDKNFKLAEKYYLASLNADPTYRSSLFNVALLYNNEMKEPIKAIPFLKQLFQHYPQHTKGYLLMGDIQMNAVRNLDEALVSFKRAIEIEPNNIQALHNICVVLVEKGSLIEAEQCLLKVMQMAPQEEYIKRHLAIVRDKIKKAQTKPKGGP